MRDKKFEVSKEGLKNGKNNLIIKGQEYEKQ